MSAEAKKMPYSVPTKQFEGMPAPTPEANPLLDDITVYGLKKYGAYLYSIVQIRVKKGKVAETLESSQTMRESQLGRIEDYLSGTRRFPD